jgi:hypothetical protein
LDSKRRTYLRDVTHNRNVINLVQFIVMQPRDF